MTRTARRGRGELCRRENPDRGRNGTKGWCERPPVVLDNCPKTKNLTGEPRPQPKSDPSLLRKIHRTITWELYVRTYDVRIKYMFIYYYEPP